jgi:ferrochelatase
MMEAVVADSELDAPAWVAAPRPGTGLLPAGHPAVPAPRIGVVLLNLGTPDGTDYWSMRRYLDEFLSDRRVIELPRVLWQPLLKLVVLTTRPTRSGRAYAAIWNKERDESPLLTTTRAQAAGLRERLETAHPELMVDWAMRYGNPSTDSVIRRLHAAGCQRLLLLPLYPQYAAATVASACDAAFRTLMRLRWQPAVRTLPAYHDHPLYIRLIADSIRDHLAGLDWRPDRVVMSFHGLPKAYLLKGDPYHCQCQKTARLVREDLGWPEERLTICFQSRFGKAEWLQPYLDATLARLPGEGVKRIAVISPGFASDCVETLEEIDQEGRETFVHAGGERFSYIPCLNASSGHIDLMEALALNELQGWLTTAARAPLAGA